MAIYPVTGEYDLELISSGDGWTGTFAALVRHAADDIVNNDAAPYGPVEVTWTGDDGDIECVTGTLTSADTDRIEIQEIFGSHVIEIDAVLKFRA